MTTITLAEMKSSFVRSLGEEKADEVFRRAAAAAGVPYKSEYSKEEALRICDVLRRDEGVVKILAMTLASKISLK